jgi:hypothetical protein
MSRHSVQAVIGAADQLGLGRDDVAETSEDEVYLALFPGRGVRESVFAQPPSTTPIARWRRVIRRRCYRAGCGTRKTKPASKTLSHVATWVIAGLRQEQFTSLVQLRARIREPIDAYNRQPFQKREGSRLSVFTVEEKPLLQPWLR